MYNRYIGNTGRVIRVSDEAAASSPSVGKAAFPASGIAGREVPSGIEASPFFEAQPASVQALEVPVNFAETPRAFSHGGSAQQRPPRPVSGPAPGAFRPPGPLSGVSGELGRLLSRLSPLKLETDDLLLMMVLYLMYRESHDEELLFIMAAMLFL